MQKPIVIRALIVLVLFIFSYLYYRHYQEQQHLNQQIKQQIVRENLDERIAAYRLERLSKCQRNAIQDAAEKTDSLLMMQAGKVTADTVTRPPRAERPTPPLLQLPEDTTPIKPLLLKSDLKQAKDSIEE